MKINPALLALVLTVARLGADTLATDTAVFLQTDAKSPVIARLKAGAVVTAAGDLVNVVTTQLTPAVAAAVVAAHPSPSPAVTAKLKGLAKKPGLSMLDQPWDDYAVCLGSP